MSLSKIFLIISAVVFLLASFGVNFGCNMILLGVALYVGSKAA